MEHFGRFVKIIRWLFLILFFSAINNIDSSTNRVILSCGNQNRTNNGSQIVWQRFGKNLTSNNNFTFNQNKLNIFPCKHLAGNYSCYIRDENGTITYEQNFQVFIKFQSDPEQVKNVTLYIGESTKTLTFKLTSYPEITNITWLHGNDSIISGEAFESILNGFHYESTATLKLSNINETTDLGEYSIRYFFDGKQFERPAANLIKGGCAPLRWHCLPNNECLYSSLRCNNMKNCPDLSDEVNCTSFGHITIGNISHVNFTHLMIYYSFDDAFDHFERNYTILVKVRENEELLVSLTTHQYQDENNFLLVDNISNATTYNITMQATSITGEFGPLVSKLFSVPLAELPKVPPLKSVSHSNYNSIIIQLEKYPRDLDYTTTFSLYQNGSKVIDDVTIHSIPTKSEFPIGRLGDGKLENDLMYTIVIKSNSVVGGSLIPLMINYTIPRMVAPGPVQSISIVNVRSSFSEIRLRVNYTRPLDDGGTKSFKGKLTICVINDQDKQTNCETHDIVLKGMTGEFGFRDLKEETKYSFEVYLLSETSQIGKKKTVFFTTPKFSESGSSGGLDAGAIAGIVIACLAGVFICSCAFYTTFKARKSPSNNMQMNNNPKNRKAESQGALEEL
ncbi:uncharacterized protein [Clytia hemisphaerica]|uniref:Ig-like domain-containing protein n=1 Tax=Clytia hemisphaerica TaxID=252671 RepID=A0A7M6DNU2_9CNID